MNPFDIIHKYYTPTDLNYQILIQHSVLVTAKALAIGKVRNERHPEDKVDLHFIAEAAMLHDIGIKETNAHDLGCFGDYPYLYHMTSGYEILMKHNLSKHARVAATHTGVGITKEQIINRGLSFLPLDISYVPETLEEKIISYADLFYSKVPSTIFYEIPKESVRTMLVGFGEENGHIFDTWDEMFSFKNKDL